MRPKLGWVVWVQLVWQSAQQLSPACEPVDECPFSVNFRSLADTTQFPSTPCVVRANTPGNPLPSNPELLGKASHYQTMLPHRLDNVIALSPDSHAFYFTSAAPMAQDGFRPPHTWDTVDTSRVFTPPIAEVGVSLHGPNDSSAVRVSRLGTVVGCPCLHLAARQGSFTRHSRCKRCPHLCWTS
jgi:hypothetical protein